MKKQFYIFVLLISIALGANAQYYSLVDSFYEGSNGINATTRAQVDTYGGTIVSDRIYSNDCAGDFHIKWSFSKDITTLKDGEEFVVYTKCDGCSSSCGFRRGAIAVAGSSGNITSIPGFDYTYNGNMEVVASNTQSINSDDWNNGYSTASFTVKVKTKKNVKYTAFYLILGNHKVYYVFRYDDGSYSDPIPNPNPKKVDCLAFLGLGQSVNGLSMGAYEGYGYTWMLQAIDYAISHIEASNCMSSTYLKDLRNRINYAQNTKIFLDEIEAYRKSLYNEAAVYCAPCKQCSD
ncbi:MAG: hypothetical protein WBM98_07050 [Maribacter sp.]|uniref:hypothetical protein n=1 Tax=Maribacter sp. TaxID=1897614 RepID=UPI003C755369